VFAARGIESPLGLASGVYMRSAVGHLVSPRADLRAQPFKGIQIKFHETRRIEIRLAIGVSTIRSKEGHSWDHRSSSCIVFTRHTVALMGNASG
jgi:hypothetical protein